MRKLMIGVVVIIVMIFGMVKCISFSDFSPEELIGTWHVMDSKTKGYLPSENAMLVIRPDQTFSAKNLDSRFIFGEDPLIFLEDPRIVNETTGTWTTVKDVFVHCARFYSIPESGDEGTTFTIMATVKRSGEKLTMRMSRRGKKIFFRKE